MGSGTLEIFAFGVQNPGLRKISQAIWIPLVTVIWNPSSTDNETRNPVAGIRNPPLGIQNPRLSWIPLQGARHANKPVRDIAPSKSIVDKNTPNLNM